MAIRWRFKPKAAQSHANKTYVAEFVVLLLAPAAALALFVQFYQLGDRTAQAIYEQQMKSVFSSYPRVKVWLNEKSVVGTSDIENQWSKGSYRLLLNNKDNIYLFYPDKFTSKTATEIIPKNHVRMVRVLPLYHSPEICD